MRSIKEVLLESLGFFGVLLYQLLNIVSAMLPAWVVASHYIKSYWLYIVIIIVFYILSLIFPVAGGTAGLVLWIWGLILVISTGPLWLIIVYAVFFVLSMIKFISALVGKH